MVNIFKRFMYSIEAEVHNLLDKQERKNPVAMLNQYVRDAEKQVSKTGELLTRQGQLQQKLQTELQQTQQMLEKRQQQMYLAQASEEQDLIIFAEQEVAAYTARKEALEQAIASATAEYFAMECKYEEMKHKIKDMKVRQLQLMGRENVTRAHYKMDDVLQNKASSAAASFDEVETYIDGLAFNIDRNFQATSFEHRLAQLEKVNSHEKIS